MYFYYYVHICIAFRAFRYDDSLELSSQLTIVKSKMGWVQPILCCGVAAQTGKSTHHLSLPLRWVTPKVMTPVLYN